MYKPRFKGTHYDMGFGYGSMLKKMGVDLSPLLKFDEKRMDLGYESLKICEKIYPEIKDEIQGMADGIELDFLSFGTFLITAGAFSFEVGCSTFCYKEDNSVYFMRNHDMFVQLKKTTESAVYRPDNGYYFLGQGDSLIGKEDGINEHGLAVGMTFVAPKTIQPGLNFLMIVRMVLEKCKNVQEAIALLHRIPTLTSQCIVIADPTGGMAVVEMCPEKIMVRRPVQGQNFMVATNHFNEQSMIGYDNKPEENWYRTLERYETVERSLSEAEQFDRHLGLDIASGKKGFLCQYDNKLSFDTLWSVCYELENREIYRAEGNPRRAAFKKDTRLAWAIGKKTKN